VAELEDRVMELKADNTALSVKKDMNMNESVLSSSPDQRGPGRNLNSFVNAFGND